MKKTSAILLAGALLLTGCGSKGMSQSSSHSETASSNGVETTEQKEEIVLTMACCSEPSKSMKELIDKFNAENNGVRIEIKQYMNSCDENGMPMGMTDEMQKQIDFEVTQELINKDTIDIVGEFSFGNGAKFEIFKRKGGFADLYSFMENDPEVNRDTLNSHILDLCERDGKLYSIPTYYWVNTMIGKSEYVSTEQNWTIDEFIDRWNAMPEGSMVNHSVTAEAVYYDVLRENTPAFVDYKNCEVHFDAPDFRKMLEFCKGFESNMGHKQDDDINYRRPNLVEHYFIRGYNNAIYEDIDYTQNTVDYTHIRDGQMTLVGFPTSDRSGAYLSGMSEIAIRANISKEKQEAAWKFIREFYLEDYQLENFAHADKYTNYENGQPAKYWYFGDGFPINNAARKQTAERFMSGYYDNENYELSIGSEPLEVLGKNRIDQADCDFLDNYINSTDRWEYPNTDRELFWIVEEEVAAYLWGEQDIDKTIDVIQNRASLWISEQM
ncbi:MAG: extracellular solute-binding protein [Ruminococcus sp.]|nr:extracellular solute-binding protein [Ruminococcus sp.]